MMVHGGGSCAIMVLPSCVGGRQVPLYLVRRKNARCPQLLPSITDTMGMRHLSQLRAGKHGLIAWMRAPSRRDEKSGAPGARVVAWNGAFPSVERWRGVLV